MSEDKKSHTMSDAEARTAFAEKLTQYAENVVACHAAQICEAADAHRKSTGLTEVEIPVTLKLIVKRGAKWSVAADVKYERKVTEKDAFPAFYFDPAEQPLPGSDEWAPTRSPSPLPPALTSSSGTVASRRACRSTGGRTRSSRRSPSRPTREAGLPSHPPSLEY